MDANLFSFLIRSTYTDKNLLALALFLFVLVLVD